MMTQGTKSTQSWFFILTLIIFIGYYAVDILNHFLRFADNLTTSFFLVLVDIIFIFSAIVFIVTAVKKKFEKLTLALPFIALISILIPVFFAFQSTPIEDIPVWKWIAEILAIGTIILAFYLLLKDKLSFLKRVRGV